MSSETRQNKPTVAAMHWRSVASSWKPGPPIVSQRIQLTSCRCSSTEPVEDRRAHGWELGWRTENSHRAMMRLWHARRQYRAGARVARRFKLPGQARRYRVRSRQADLSMLRRLHDHHRDLRARCNATASADSSTHRNQGRHLMTASHPRKSDRRTRCLSTGHGRARPDIRLSSQIVRRLAVRRDPPLIQQPFQRPSACCSASTPFTHLIRGNQIPITHAAPPTCPSRGFLPWRFAYAGPGVRRATIMGPASQTFTIPGVVNTNRQ
jgi:hypothetical protein